jgi:23S rRNA pseudouridine1911/1915/1917 synthase
MTDSPGEPEHSTYMVPEELAGARLDQALTKLADDLSRAAAQRLIEAGMCLLNGAKSKSAARVAEGDELQVTILPPEPTKILAEDIPLDVVYEDADLIVINKPSGMVVHPAVGHPSGTLVNALLAHCDDLSGIGGELRPGIVHRLDKETSGLLVAAKNDQAHRHLSQQIETRAAKRTYWAIVYDKPSPPEGAISAPIARHRQQRQMMGVVEGGREATTHYEVLEAHRIGPDTPKKGRTISLVELRLDTGRTHQIRVHMTHIGHPVLGDPLYGRKRRLPQNTPLSLVAALKRLQGQALHARRLSFEHPTTGERLQFEAEPPQDFQDVLDALRKAGAGEES